MSGQQDLNAFFYPESIAVIGASHDENKPSGIVLKNLLNGFSGRIYPVNPHYTELNGIPCFPTITDIPEVVTLSVLITPPDAVPALLREHAEKGVHYVIIATSGFGETEGGEGLEIEIREIAVSSGIRIIGPNCLGVFHPSSGLDTFFLPSDRVPRPSAGNISVISQSGSVLGTTMILLEQEGLGIAKAVSYGNRVDVNETDLLEYLSSDDETDVIGLCIESIKDGRRFISTAQRCNKPIVAFKLGQEPAGKKASRSHTGSMSGMYEIFQAAFRRSGIFEANTIEEFLDLLKALSMQNAGQNARQKPGTGNRVLIVTNAGGIGVMTADLCNKAGLDVPGIPSEPLKKLKAVLPSYYSLGNPIDLTGNSKDAEFGLVLKTALDYFDAAILVPFMTVPGMTPKLGDVIINSMGNFQKPVLSLCPFSKDGKMLEDAFAKCGIPLFPTPSRLVKTLAHLLRKKYTEPVPDKIRDFSEVSGLINGGQAKDTGLLSLADKIRLLDAMGLKYPESIRCNTVTEAVSAARKIGFPVAMKIASPDIIHKTDVGGVRLDVRNFKELRQTFKILFNTSVNMYDEKARIAGIDIEKMVSPGVELIIGGKRDPQFGPVVLFGLGGIFTEVIRDMAIEIAPVTQSVARRMIESIKGFHVLKGIRNMSGVDLDAIEDAIVSVSEFISAFPEIEEMEFNPVIVYPKGITVVDMRIIFGVSSKQKLESKI